ncbi:sugar phosphate nucleotidyltransferase [Paenibacillus xylanilyticus]|uniref:sugar phosphate nucleotidyltransferase n=1 Tax=Paenibacillus xylanilyticus TaxID=248903 RepID=UPI0039A2C97A
MKGLILCAGKGSRLYPFTFSYPKSLIPVANTPLLHSCIDKLVEQEVSEIGIVIQKSQESLIRSSLENVTRWSTNITLIYQKDPKGIADAILQAEHFIGQDSFILLLGDNLISISLSQLKKQIEEHGNHAALLLSEVDSPQDYGIAEVEDHRIVKLVEKPKAPKSNLAVLGAYGFTSSIFEAAKKIEPSARGEYEITDAIQWLIQQGYSVSYHQAEIANIDVGTLQRWLDANRKMLREMPVENDIHPSVILKNCKIIAPVSIEAGCILEDCVVGPYVSIGADSTIESCYIRDSILLSNVHIKQLSHAVVNTVVGIGSTLAGLEAKRKGDEE